MLDKVDILIVYGGVRAGGQPCGVGVEPSQILIHALEFK